MIRYRLFSVCTLILFYITSEAQTGGTGTYNFLSLTGSARAAGLGEKNISVKEDNLDLVYLNPALLTPSCNNQLSLNYINYYANIGYGYAAYAHHYDSIGTFSIGMQYVDYGSFPGRDEKGNQTGDFYAKDVSLHITYSRAIDSSFNVGVSLKPVYSSYERYTSSGFATDFGVTYTSHDKSLTVAAAVRNLGFQIKRYSDESEPLAYEILLGVSKKLEHAPFRLSLTAHSLQKYNLRFDDEVDNESTYDTEIAKQSKLEKFGDNALRHLIFGVDFLPSKSFYISAAYNYQRRQEMALKDYPGTTGFSFGAGIKLRRFSISYGHSVHHVSGGSNHFSLLLNLSQGY